MEEISYLLLGEGDFTYSLDLCRYIASSNPSLNGNNAATAQYTITCTGIDTIEELRSKYKDADFVLRNIRDCCNENQDMSNESNVKRKVTTKILHGINAVQAHTNVNDDTESSLRYFDRVMFHHPHLGKEDAKLHSRFLHHLFYAMDKRWLKPGNTDVSSSTQTMNNTATSNSRISAQSKPQSKGGLLYLTLVNGQCHRWKCVEAARKHGLIFIRAAPFTPPPPVNNPSSSSSTTYYQLRRHQSGKSFAKRRRMHDDKDACNGTLENDSETLVFGRACDYNMLADTKSNIGLLPWEQQDDSTHSNQRTTLSSGSSNQYSCPYCTKSFREDRSLKNHMINSHPDCDEVASWGAKRIKVKKNKLLKNDNNTNQKADTQQSNGHLASANLNNDGSPITCSICEEQRHNNDSETTEENNARVFPHRQALLDHQRAKHFGSYSNIKPDWFSNKQNGEGQDEGNDGAVECNTEGKTTQIQPPFGSCPICGVPYSSEDERRRHELEFIPTIASLGGENHPSQSLQQKCIYCNKSFRDARARQQHENFCSTRNIASKETVDCL